jgi:hypothetical protein
MKRILLAMLFANLAVGSCFALNPQPLPPGIYAKAMLNPQPLPPFVSPTVTTVNKVMLNPQPLPPQK